MLQGKEEKKEKIARAKARQGYYWAAASSLRRSADRLS
jgi:hypothetical protein